MSAAPDTAREAERRRILSGLVLIMFLGALGQLIVAPALPTINAELGDVENLPWIITAYLVAAAVATPILGKLSDIYSRRRMLLASLALFLVGSVLCALAPTTLILALARAVQGLGGGALIALSQATIGDVIPPRDRGRYQAYIGTAFASASLAGPVLGGALAEHLHWSAIFWLNVPFGLVAMLVVHRALRHLRHEHAAPRLDLTGAALLTAAIVAVLLALSWGGVRYPWLSAPVLGLFGAAVAGAGLYALHARRLADAFLPLDLLHDKVVAPASITSFFVMVSMIGLSAYMPIYFELVGGLSTTGAGLAQSALMAGTTSGGMFMGRRLGRLDRPKWLAAPLLAVAVLVLAALSVAADQLPLVALALMLGAVAFALGMMFPLTTVSIQNAIERRHLGVAMATLNLLRATGGAVGSAIFGAILLGGASGSRATVAASLDAASLAGAFGWMFAGIGVTMVLGIIALATMESRPLRGTL